jgi:hypothetical protein
MKKNCLSVLLPALCLLLTVTVHAQDSESKEESSGEKSYFKIGLSYINDNVYLGRKDSVKVPYLTPSLGYYSKSGFYITGSLSYLPTAGESRIDLFSVETGYSFSKKKTEGEFSISKDFFSGQSFNVKSEVIASASGYLKFDLGFLKPSIGAGVNFANVSDYNMTGGIEHDFSLADDKLSISPTFIFNASTQNYYNSYYQKRKYAKNRFGKINTYDITANVLGVDKFKIMDYELSLPFEYSPNKLTLGFTPTLAMPTNPNQVDLTIKSSNGNSNSKTYTEKLKSVFYFSFDIAYKF